MDRELCYNRTQFPVLVCDRYRTEKLRTGERLGDRMATFRVELKRVVDDSYPIEIGFDLMDHLVRI